ncbi:hypothetical protein [Flavobacterium sp.]|uniref:hypothetical protein n=1 Tax=Flavobacterium sp. TaxID=239 RepID=UPI00262B470F|nr:hypothetical protein [Flavobacterium sp.]
MNSEEIKKTRGDLDNVLYKIQTLKDKLEKLEENKETKLQMTVDLGSLRFDDMYLQEKPIREFLVYQIKLSLQKSIKFHESRLRQITLKL